MRIGRISKTKQGRFALFDEEGEFLFSVDDETLVKNRLTEGAALDAASLSALREQSDLCKAKDKALGCLSLRDYAGGELYEKLCQTFDEHTAAAAVAELCRMELIDDARFARRRAEYWAAQNKSAREIRRPRNRRNGGLPRADREKLPAQARERPPGSCARCPRAARLFLRRGQSRPRCCTGGRGARNGRS